MKRENIYNLNKENVIKLEAPNSINVIKNKSLFNSILLSDKIILYNTSNKKKKQMTKKILPQKTDMCNKISYCCKQNLFDLHLSNFFPFESKCDENFEILFDGM